MAFYKRTQRAPVTQVASSDIASFAGSDNVLFVAYINGQDEFVSRHFGAIARRHSAEYSFGAVVTKEPSSFKCHNNIDGIELTETNVAKLEFFIEQCAERLISPLDGRTEFNIRQVRAVEM